MLQIKSRIDTSTGASDSEQGRLKAVHDKPACVTVWRRNPLTKKLHLYDDFEEYINITSGVYEDLSNFFLLVN